MVSSSMPGSLLHDRACTLTPLTGVYSSCPFAVSSPLRVCMCMCVYMCVCVCVQVRALTIALAFHQLLEGLALSSFIARAQLSRVSGVYMLILCLPTRSHKHIHLQKHACSARAQVTRCTCNLHSVNHAYALARVIIHTHSSPNAHKRQDIHEASQFEQLRLA